MLPNQVVAIIDKPVPTAVGVNWVDYLNIENEAYDAYSHKKVDEAIGPKVALLAQQRLAEALLNTFHPTSDGRLRVSKRKLMILFNKIGVTV